MPLSNETRIERQIVAYLSKHPAAQDTLRGIIEWWFLKEQIEQTTADVKAALEKLVGEGKLSAWTGPDNTVHYRNRLEGPEKGIEDN